MGVTRTKVTWGQALAWRMERQMLEPVGAASVEAVVGRLGAIQAQSDLTTELSVGLLRVDWFNKKNAPASGAVEHEAARVGKILGRSIRADG